MAEETKDIAMYDASVQSEKSTESSSSSSSENDSDGGSESAHAVDQVELYLNSNVRSLKFSHQFNTVIPHQNWATRVSSNS